ncbi:hypothetical protein [Globicatella sanguinis]
MKRDFERRLINILSIWQILDGLFTCGYYGIYITVKSLMKSKVLIPGYTLISITLGGILIGFGLLNLYLNQKKVKDNMLIGNSIWLLIFQAIISYLILDIISLILLVTIIVILLAKNKAIKIVR